MNYFRIFITIVQIIQTISLISFLRLITKTFEKNKHTYDFIYFYK